MRRRVVDDQALIGRVYEYLRNEKTAGISQIAAALDENDLAAISRAINTLLGVGAVYVSALGNDVVSIIEPNVGVSRALRSAADRLFEDVRAIEAMTEFLENTTTEYEKQVSVNSDTEFITTRDAVMVRAIELTEAAHNSIDSMVPELPTAETLADSRAEDKRLSKRGLRIRVIEPEPARFNDAIRAYVADTTGADAVRTSVSIPIRVVIVDNATALVQDYVDNDLTAAIVTSNQILVKALVGLFEAVWMQAQPLEYTISRKSISEVELTILHRLLNSETDAQIAKNIGRGERTVSRHINELMQRTGTKSRFGLGAAAVRLGWVE